MFFSLYSDIVVPVAVALLIYIGKKVIDKYMK